MKKYQTEFKLKFVNSFLAGEGEGGAKLLPPSDYPISALRNPKA